MTETTSIGGVIVRTRSGFAEILLIRDLSYDDWFLPKGHTEAGESEEQTVLRCIQEQVALSDLESFGPFGHYQRYSEEKDETKTEKYILFKKIGNEQPETEQGKSWELGWFSKHHLPMFYIPEQESLVRDNWDMIEKIR